MMPQTNPQCSAMEDSGHDPPPSHCQVERSTDVEVEGRQNAEPGQRNGRAASSSPESGSTNGEGKRGGKSRRRRKRTPYSEGPDAAVEGSFQQDEEPDPCTVLLGLQAECTSVWFQRSIYEQAEGLYHCWLANSPARASRPSVLPPSPENHVAPEPPKSPSPPPPACSHADQVACHHMVQAVWVNKPMFDRAERRFVEASLQPSIPNSLDLALGRPAAPVTPPTPDEGYLSLSATPATPATPAQPRHDDVASPTPGPRQPINGLPRVPVELLRDVWLEKPLYDRAEATFYQNLYGNNSKPRSNSCPSACRSTEHPQSLMEEEEEEDEEEEGAAAVLVAEEKKAVVPQGKAEVFHALHPIQEEEEPADLAEEVSEEEEDVEESSSSAGGACYFLHPDSERVWLDQRCYEAAESRFYSRHADGASQGPDVGPSSDCPTGSKRDKKMSATDFLAQERIWFDKPRYDEAERRFYEHMNGAAPPAQQESAPVPCLSAAAAAAAAVDSTEKIVEDVGANSILQDIARARENIQKSLAGLKTSLRSTEPVQPPLIHQWQSSTGSAAGDKGDLVSRIKNLELENQNLHKVWLVVEDLRSALSKLESRVAVLEKSPDAAAPVPAPAAPVPAPAPEPAPAVAPAPTTNGTTSEQKISTQDEEEDKEEEDEDDDDFDLFGSDEEGDEESERLKEQRVKEYAERKAKKPALIAKSSILLDVKPWDDETDMVKLEECVRSIEADGLLWGTSKLVPVGYGIRKLQIACVVEDDKVGTDLLEEEITKFEDYVQSVDVAAFNKI